EAKPAPGAAPHAGAGCVGSPVSHWCWDCVTNDPPLYAALESTAPLVGSVAPCTSRRSLSAGDGAAERRPPEFVRLSGSSFVSVTAVPDVTGHFGRYGGR